MKKSQQGAAVAVIAIGIVIVAISAGVLISELRKERAARERLEQDVTQLREDMETLKSQNFPIDRFIRAKLKESEISL